jgi:PAS domain S-box-containing protein
MDEAARSRTSYLSTSTRYEQLFRAVFDSSALAIEITNMDGFIVASNPAYQQLVGREMNELSSMRYSDVVHPDDAEIDEVIFQSLLDGDCDAYVVEKRFVHSGGATIYGNMHVSLIRDEEGNSLYAMGMIVDITELKRLEEFQHRFVADAAHELRGPVAALVGFAEILGERWADLSPTQIANTIAALKRQGERLSGLTHTLLDLSKIERDKGKIELTPLCLADVVSALLEAEPGPAGKSLRIDVPGDIVAMAEIRRLEQVLRNLLTNAYRYGGTNIVVEAGRDGNNSWVAVYDDGAGVSADMREKLFDPFWRGGNVGSTQGSGLGLAIVSSLVEAMGGRITCEEVEPQGLRFVVTLEAATQ